MSEGHVYTCKWRKKDGVYAVWLEKHPRLRATGDSLDEALNELSGAVCLRIGDGEAAFDLDPPRQSEGSLSYLALSWNNCWRPPRITMTDFANLYEGGTCDVCCKGIGPRSKIPLPIGWLGNGDLLGPVLRGPQSLIVSEQFRKQLKRAEEAALEWREVNLQIKSQRRFFEVVARNPLPAVADKSRKVSGWQCPSCGFRLFGVCGDYEHEYVSSERIGKSRPALLTIDEPHLLRIAISRSRWNEMRGRKGTRGILTCSVVALSKQQAWPTPEVPKLTKSQIESIRREFRRAITG